MSFQYDLMTNLVAEMIGLVVGILATYWIVERALEKRRLLRAKPIAQKAIRYKVWAVLRDMMLIYYPMLRFPDEELKTCLKNMEVERFASMSDKTERLLDIYGNRIPDEIQEDLMNFAERADRFAHTLGFVQLVSERDVCPTGKVKYDFEKEFKKFKKDFAELWNETEKLIVKLIRKQMVPKEWADFITADKEIYDAILGGADASRLEEIIARAPGGKEVLSKLREEKDPH